MVLSKTMLFGIQDVIMLQMLHNAQIDDMLHHFTQGYSKRYWSVIIRILFSTFWKIGTTLALHQAVGS